MATSVSQELYPFSTSDSKAIPLDVILPKGCILKAIAANAAASLTIPTDYDLVFIYTSVAVLIDFENTASYPLADATEYASAIFLPEEGTMTLRLPSTGAVKIVPLLADEAGTVVIQNIQKWAALGLQRQLTTR